MHAYGQGMSANQISSKSSTSLTFILKVKDMNRVHWEVHDIISQTLTDRTNIATANTKSCIRLEYLHLILAHFKDQPAHFNC